MYTFPTATINNMTFTALRWGQFPTITYDTSNMDVTAGNEIVIVAPDLSDITIQIEDGVSTNLQIQTAILNARGISVESLYAGDLVVTDIAMGHDSDTATAQGPTALTGAMATPPASTAPIRTVGTLDFTDVSDDIGTTHATPETTIFTPTISGMYLLHFYGLATVSPSGADAAPNLYMKWTDERGLQTYFNFAGNLDQTFSDGPNSVTIPIWAMGGTPVWMYTAAGNYSGTVKWSFHFSVTNLIS